MALVKKTVKIQPVRHEGTKEENMKSVSVMSYPIIKNGINRIIL